jgi:hypothetical protein
MLWQNSKMTALYYDDTADENYPCAVRISESEILVEYNDEGIVQYRGKNDGSGHFELRSDVVNGRATLHMFSGALRLEGSWVEDGARGMWRIDLA